MAITLTVNKERTRGPARAVWNGRTYTIGYIIKLYDDGDAPQTGDPYRNEKYVLDHFSATDAGAPNVDEEGDDLPWPRRPHPEDAAATCDDLSIECIREFNADPGDPTAGDMWFKATATYATHLLQSRVNFNLNTSYNTESYSPTENYGEATVERGFRHEMVVREYDLDGRPFVNSAFVPVDPPYQERESYETLTITQNFPYGVDPASGSLAGSTGYDVSLNRIYINSVNDAVWPESAASVYQFDPFTLIISDIRMSLEFSGAVYYWRRTVQVDVGRLLVTGNPKGPWQPSYLDMGIYQINDDGKRERIKDDKDQEITEPWPLNGAGRVLPRPDDPDYDYAGSGFYKHRRTRAHRPFAAFFGF